MDQLESKINKIKSPIAVDGIDYYFTLIKVGSEYMAEYKDLVASNVILSITHTKLQAVIDTVLSETRKLSRKIYEPR